MGISLVFETHSKTDDNERGSATGWLGGRLSEEGRVLAAELGDRRRKDSIDAVFSSDLARAVETSTIAFDGSGIPVLLDCRLRECDFGAGRSHQRWSAPTHRLSSCRVALNAAAPDP